MSLRTIFVSTVLAGLFCVNVSQAATVYVTSLKDKGPGTLRDALQRGSRKIAFRVGGEIRLSKMLEVTVSDVVIEGDTAPRPGVTITGKPFSLRNARNITIRHLRFRNSSDDNLRISGDCRNILIENCSSTHGGDGAIDITNDYKTLKRPNGVTIRNCLIAATDKAMLVVGVDNLTLEGNLFTNTGQRNPQIRESRNFNLINNVIRNFTVYGILIRANSSGNIVGNSIPLSPLLPKRPDRTLRIDHSIGKNQIHTARNSGPRKYDLNQKGNSNRPIGKLSSRIADADSLERLLPSRVGAQPLDRIDAALVRNDPRIQFRESMTKDK